MTTDELFASLNQPDGTGLGFYHAFLSGHLVERLPLADLPKALAWAEARPEGHGHFHTGHEGLVARILAKGVEHMDVAAVLSDLAPAVLSRLRKHDFSGGKTPTLLAKALESRHDLRLKLVEAMVPWFQDAQHDSFFMMSDLRLLVPGDLSWLINRLEAALTPALQTGFAHLVRWVFDRGSPEAISAVIEAADRRPVLFEIMSSWLKCMVIDSDEAREARKLYRDEQRHRDEMEERRKPKPLSPLPAERLLTLLDQFEGGDLEAWWKLCHWLGVKDDGKWCEGRHRMDIRELVGWKTASNSTKVRLADAAERYLAKRDSSPEEWFIKRNIIHGPAVAGLRALLLLANERPNAFQDLPSDVWRQWMPAILRLHCYGERDHHRLLTTKAFNRAPTSATEWVIRVVSVENSEGHGLPVLQKLPDEWDDDLGTALLKRIKQGRLKPQCFEGLLTAVVEHRVRDSMTLLRSTLPRKCPEDPESRQLALHTAELLMLHGERGDWSRIWNLIRESAAFGENLVEGFAYKYDRSPAGILKTLSETDVGALWEWMLAQYPVAEDPDRSRGGTITTRYAMTNLRDSLVSHLANAGTPEGCGELQRLYARYPQFTWFRQIIARGQEQMRRLTWKPISPSQLFQLPTNKRARLIQSGRQLLEAIMDSLTVLQEDLQGETPQARYLWNGSQPKREEDISDWVKIHLEKDLKQQGVVLDREVQIHRGERTDILVTAVTSSDSNGSFGRAKVIIEVKGSWHAELKSAMKTQLVQRYLKDNDCRHGLYLVGWFGLDFWDKGDRRRRQVGTMTPTALRDGLTRQAEELSNELLTVKAQIVDFTSKRPSDKLVRAAG